MARRSLKTALLVFALLFASAPAWASFTFVGGCGGNDDSGTTATVSCNVAGVQAGDLAFVTDSFEGSTTTATCSDGTSSLTQTAFGVTAGARGTEPWLAAFYIMSSSASGTVTYTTTLGANRAFKQIAVQVWRPSAAASLDGTAVAASGGTTPISSGNITTTGTDGLAFGSYAEFGQATTSELINGVAEDQKQIANAPSSRNTTQWSRTYSSGFTGDAGGTMGGNEQYTLGVTAFKIGAGGGGASNVPRAMHYKKLMTQFIPEEAANDDYVRLAVGAP